MAIVTGVTVSNLPEMIGMNSGDLVHVRSGSVDNKITLTNFAESLKPELFSPFIITLIDDVDAATARQTFGVVADLFTTNKTYLTWSNNLNQIDLSVDIVGLGNDLETHLDFPAINSGMTSTASKLIGRGASTTGDLQEVSLAPELTFDPATVTLKFDPTQVWSVLDTAVDTGTNTAEVKSIVNKGIPESIYLDGVTSAIQTQIDSKAGLDTVNTFSQNQTFSSDVTISGNFFVSGTTTQVDSQLVTADTVVVFNDGEAGAGVTAGFSGIQIDRGTAIDYEFGFNETTDLFEVGEVGDRQPVATREVTPIDGGMAIWDSTESRFKTVIANTTNIAEGTNLYHTEARVRAITATEAAAGTVEKATNAEALAGTVGKFPDAANVHAAFKQFGLGDAKLITNLDTAGFGFFLAAPTATGAPPGISGSGNLWGITYRSSATDSIVQEVVDRTENRKFRRVSSSGSIWNPWDEEWNSANLPSPMQTTGGTITGQLNIDMPDNVGVNFYSPNGAYALTWMADDGVNGAVTRKYVKGVDNTNLPHKEQWLDGSTYHTLSVNPTTITFDGNGFWHAGNLIKGTAVGDVPVYTEDVNGRGGLSGYGYGGLATVIPNDSLGRNTGFYAYSGVDSPFGAGLGGNGFRVGATLGRYAELMVSADTIDTYPHVYARQQRTTDVWSDPVEMWHDGNFNPDAKMNNAVSAWNEATDGTDRFYFDTRTIIAAPGNVDSYVELRPVAVDGAYSTYIYPDGTMKVDSNVTSNTGYFRANGGYSGSWGAGSGFVGAFSADVPNNTSASWILAGHCIGVRRGGIQMLNNTGAMRFYAGSQYMYLDTSGNLTANGNVAGYSDETVKTNWRSMPEDFIEQLAKVKHGIYDRTDIELTQIGVGAQSLQKVGGMGPAILEDDEGKLSVAYAQAAMVSAVELAEQVVKLKQENEKLKSTLTSFEERLVALETK